MCPEDVHTLNDAILEAAKATTRSQAGIAAASSTSSPTARSTAPPPSQKDVIKYLNTHKIAVYATLIHDTPQIPRHSAFIDRIHLPLQMRDNILPIYAAGHRRPGRSRVPPEGHRGRASPSITEEVRNQYTVGYYTHEPFIDGKYRKLDVRVLRPGLTVIAKEGYYPTAADTRPPAVRVAQ